MSRVRVLFSGLLVTALLVSLSVSAFAAEAITSFDDVESSHWAYNDILTIVNKGAINGTKAPVNGVGHYDPDSNVTLGQFLAIATRLVASDKIVSGNYDNWAIPNYNAAVQTGIIKGSDFSPSNLNNPISREDMALILVGVAKVNGETLEITEGIESTINDYGSISANRQQAVKQAYSNGLLQGSGGNFSPTQTTKRSHIAAVFCRVMNYTARPTPPTATVTPPTDEKMTMGGYVSNEGNTKGRLGVKFSRQYDLEALSQIRMGEDDKGVYVTFTAPQLPAEISGSFSYNFSAVLHAPNGDYFASNARANLKSGETKTIYFALGLVGGAGDGGVKSSQIGDALVGVSIVNEKNAYMLGHQADTSSKSKAVEEWYDGDAEIIDYDTSAIFAGIGF